jgi:hypothetical protein
LLLLLEMYNAITLPYTHLQAPSYSEDFVVVSLYLALYQHLNHEPQSSHNVLWQHELHDETFALWQMA